MANLRFFNQAVTGNIIMFIPVGIIVSCLVTKNKVEFLCPVVWSMAFSILAEIMQFVLATGACDVDDIITNTIGGVIGTLIYALIFFIAKEDCTHTQSIITLIAYALPPFLFSYLRMQTVSMEQLHFDVPDAIILLVYFIPIGLLVHKYFPKYFLIYALSIICFAIFFYVFFIKYI